MAQKVPGAMGTITESRPASSASSVGVGGAGAAIGHDGEVARVDAGGRHQLGELGRHLRARDEERRLGA